MASWKCLIYLPAFYCIDAYVLLFGIYDVAVYGLGTKLPVILSEYSTLSYKRKIIDCEREIDQASMTLYRLKLVLIPLNQKKPPFERFNVTPFKCLCYSNSIFNIIVKEEGLPHCTIHLPVMNQ